MTPFPFFGRSRGVRSYLLPPFPPPSCVLSADPPPLRGWGGVWPGVFFGLGGWVVFFSLLALLQLPRLPLSAHFLPVPILAAKLFLFFY